jgi:hypothetical protein
MLACGDLLTLQNMVVSTCNIGDLFLACDPFHANFSSMAVRPKIKRCHALLLALVTPILFEWTASLCSAIWRAAMDRIKVSAHLVLQTPCWLIPDNLCLVWAHLYFANSLCLVFGSTKKSEMLALVHYLKKCLTNPSLRSSFLLVCVSASCS